MQVPASRNWLLPFHRAILARLIPEDGNEEDRDRLVLLAPGLGLRRIVATFLYAYANSKNLVLFLNASASELAGLNNDLKALGVGHDTIRSIHHEVSGKQRSEAYMEGGILSITTRILIVDMLTKRIPTSLVTGIVVLHAENVTPTSTEAFIIRIYRQENKQGFLLAFSTHVEQLAASALALQTTMAQLRLRNVDIWPRFHQYVDRDLGQNRADVTELHQPPTRAMRMIQAAIVECLEATLGEIRRSKLAVEVDDFQAESMLHKAFDTIVRKQLDPVWHRLAPSTKQLVGDLSTLRTLLHYLVSYDAVTFYMYLETVLAANAGEPGRTRQSLWLLSDASNVIFREAQRRLWCETDGSSELVLETPPKWALLREILDEIEQDAQQRSAPILIMTETERNAAQLRIFLAHADEDPAQPGRPVMAASFAEYVAWKQNMAQLHQTSQVPSDTRLSEALQSKVARAPQYKRRRVRGGMTAPAQTHAAHSVHVPIAPAQTDAHLLQDMHTDECTVDDTYFGVIDPGDIVVLHTYHGDDDDAILEALCPGYVIMYDPSPRFVRQVEVYRRLHHQSLRVYFMLYTDTLEEQLYLAGLRREKDAFERLIRQKATMAIPLTADGNVEEDADQRMLRSLSTRIAGGAARHTIPTVVVDMREFRSTLPSLLHAAGMQVVPATLQVGDYVIAPEMCVERKSLPDLVQSLHSGRLYTQCESMSIHYQHPILLIEFDQDKAFTLQSLGEMKHTKPITPRTAPNDLEVQGKLVLLTLAFPRLRIIWSSSPYATAEIFAELKQNYDEPSPATAAAIGMDNGTLSEQAFNLTPVDMLRAMPGVTAKNYTYLTNHIDSVQALCHVRLETIQQRIGAEPGRRLYTFLHTQLVR
ncbi:DNA repair protein RAD16 [Malassezia vespertilionis]|uniref:DNA repair protein RAD16 n=1 Tax=Malassezia vespertilionis TaxID=2020962 RepID=UPI0024B220B9|nr:DNA repair protein RAD16 [Malassezia vespertilionis]WFD07905.1 DNA repair protein RAD16 [Malassezia vespertilionis]